MGLKYLLLVLLTLTCVILLQCIVSVDFTRIRSTRPLVQAHASHRALNATAILSKLTTYKRMFLNHAAEPVYYI